MVKWKLFNIDALTGSDGYLRRALCGWRGDASADLDLLQRVPRRSNRQVWCELECRR